MEMVMSFSPPAINWQKTGFLNPKSVQLSKGDDGKARQRRRLAPVQITQRDAKERQRRGKVLICSAVEDESGAANNAKFQGEDGGPAGIPTGQFSGTKSGKSQASSLLPSDIVVAGGKIPSTRRLLLGGLTASAAALGGNFLGITSALLNINPDLSRSLRADVLFPVQGFKRCVESGAGFEFIYPESWLGDQTLLYRAAQRGERERALDPPPPVRSRPATSATSVVQPVEPLLAFGPPGSSGELNISVVIAPASQGFRLERLGAPQQVGELLLSNVIAPPGSDKTATLLSSSRRQGKDAPSGGPPISYYILEFTVQGPTFSRHNLAVYSTTRGRLYTLNAQAPEERWLEVSHAFSKAAESFRVFGPGAAFNTEM